MHYICIYLDQADQVGRTRQVCLILNAEMVGAGASMATHDNCIYVFGGMDEDRAEHMYLWRWNLSSEVGFEPITHR